VTFYNGWFSQGLPTIAGLLGYAGFCT